MDQYAVFGNPIAHSKSPDIHHLFAKQTGEVLDYNKQRVAEGSFKAAADAFLQGNGRGLNITVPFKLEAFDYADELTERAQIAGAVNTLKRLDTGKVLGDNTDGQGMVADIIDNHGWAVAGRRVLLLGAGGAVRGVLQPLLEQQPECLVIANRTLSKAQRLADIFKSYGCVEACGFGDLPGQQFDLVINGTSASLSGDLPPLPDTLLRKSAGCYDMMYGTKPTVFLTWAKTHGAAHIADGLGMLVGQAAEAFTLWRGVRPCVAPVIEALRAELQSS